MENYGVSRFEAKTETFDPCAMEAANIGRETAENWTEPRIDEGRDENRDETEQTSGPIATVQPNPMTDTTLTPVRLPAILDGEFFSVVRVEDTNVTVRCLQCDKLLNGNLKSTGNFLSHVKRVHPFMMDRIKCKSNQRKPAIAYIDVTSVKTMDTGRNKRVYRKFYKPEEGETIRNEEEEAAASTVPEQSQNWLDSPIPRRRKYDDEQSTFTESPQVQKLPHHNGSFVVVDDEFDAIGKNVAAKLRNMRLDQRIVAEKLLNDVLFEAQLGTLHRHSVLRV